MKSFWSILLAFILTASIGVGIFFGFKYKDNIKEYFSISSSSLEDSSISSEDNSSSSSISSDSSSSSSSDSSSSSSSTEEPIDYKELYEELLINQDGITITKVEIYEIINLSNSDGLNIQYRVNSQSNISYDMLYNFIALESSSNLYAQDNKISELTNYRLDKDTSNTLVTFETNIITFDSVSLNVVDVANVGDYSNYDRFLIDSTYSIIDNICNITINILEAE